MKKTWDELVAAKQAEREQQRLKEEEEFENSSSGRCSPHLVPDIVVSTPEVKPRKFEPNSKKNYVELSKKLSVQAKDEPPVQETKRQNWRNKEIRNKAKEVKEPEEIVTFSKTYSFRNLPRGKVAKLQQKFENTGPIHFSKPPLKVQKETIKTEAIIEKVLPTKEPNVPIQTWTAKPIVPIQTWEETKSVSDIVKSLEKPGSRYGFHASTPSLTHAIEDSILDDKVEHNKFLKDYLDALKDRRDKAREKASELSFKVPLKQPLHCPRTKYFAFENVDLNGKVISWTEIISVHSVYDVSISEPVFV